MVQLLEEKNIYLSSFARFGKEWADNENSSTWRLRQAAIDRFAELGFPTLRDEEWRFTNLAPLVKIPFQPALKGQGPELTSADVRALTFAPWDCLSLVFVNGYFAAELSAWRVPGGLVLRSLADILQNDPALVEPYLAQYADYEDRSFTALNTAFFPDGAFVNIPKGMVVPTPIHLVFVSLPGGEATVSHPRNLIVAGINSQATIVETYVGLEETGDAGVYFTNAVTELILGENAVIDHYKVQRENKKAYHITTLQVEQTRSSNLTSHSIALGGSLVRNEVNVVLDAPGCECTLNGLYLGVGHQLIDNHTRIDHAKPFCTSHELYKGILDGHSRGVFNGKIYVHQDAQKTDAKQTNKTLLLSEDAVINTKPQLEIFADDVKCTHGATIGQLADEAIFYLRSRGIGRQDARSLLTFAFANDIIGRIKIEPIRAQMEKVLLAGRNLPEVREVQEAVL